VETNIVLPYPELLGLHVKIYLSMQATEVLNDSTQLFKRAVKINKKRKEMTISVWLKSKHR